MSLFGPRAARRFAIIGRLGDVLIVVGVGLRMAQRKGWLSDDQAAQMGLTDVSGSEPLGVAEYAIVAAALFRLLRRGRPRS